MRRTRLASIVAIVVSIGIAERGLAQGQSGFGTTGGFGSSSFGTGGMGSSGFGAFSPGAGSFGSGFGGGGFGGGFGSSGFGGGGFGGQGFGGQGFGQGFGQGGFGGGQGGQMFVGRDSGDMQNLMNNMGRGANQFFQQLDRSLNRGQRGDRQANQSEENTPPPIRVKLRMAFDDNRPISAAATGKIQGRLEYLLADRKLGSPEVSVDGGVVTLRGTVPSEGRRLVVEKLVVLEPGVTEVRNQMTIDPTAAAPTRPESAE